MENNQNYENQVNENQVNENQVNENQVNYDYSVPQGDVEPVVMDAPEKDPSKGLGIASLVCGIASLPMMCCCTYLGIPLGIVAVVLGILGKKKNPANKLALVGIILGAIGIVLCIVGIIVGLVTGAAMGFAEGFSDGLNSTYYY